MAAIERRRYGAAVARIRPVQWLKAHPYVADSLLALIVAAIQVTNHIWSNDAHAYPRSHPSVIGAIVSAALAVPLVWRRRSPIQVLAATTTVLAIAEIGLTNTGGWTAALVAIYSLGAHCRGRIRTWVLAVFAAILSVGWTVAWRQGTFAWGDMVSAVIIFTIAFVIGDNLQGRRQAVKDLAERADRAERERELLARDQVRDERTRIARELHDVIAHSLSVMVIQAGAARRQLPTDPQKAAEALGNVESTGRAAMDEMRRVLGVLRNDREPDAELLPQPSLCDLQELIASSPDVPVHLHTEGSFDDLPAGVELSAYRVVQEAITNIRRHAGTVSAVDVVLSRDAQGLLVEVHDDGHRVWPKLTAPAAFGVIGVRERASSLAVVEVHDDGRRSPNDVAPHASGFGLIGMRERVAAYGGELSAGPRNGGGWSVRARFPAAAR
jgi:signal transduction histidine kinase